MRPVRLFLLSIMLLCFSHYSPAQNWSGILAPSRAADWSQAGVQGGIPSASWAQSGSTISAYSGSATTINNALAACGTNQFVKLGTGTFTLSTGIVFSRSNCVLRGAGADQTKLVINGNTSGCSLFFNSAIRMCAGSGNIGTNSGGGPGPDHSANWTTGYARGTTQITVSSTTGMQVGTTLFLDQLNDGSDGWPAAGDIYMCESAQPCSWEGGNSFARTGRVQTELHMVTAINGNTVTISPGVLAPNFRSGQSPGAWWGNASVVLHNSGVEDFTVDFSGSGQAGIEIVNGTNVWVKGVRGIFNGGPGSFVFHVVIVNGFHVTTKDNYFYGPTVQGNTQYTYTPQVSGSLLFENNILHHNVSPTAPNDPETGSVYAYNFVKDAYYATSGFQQHNAGDMLNLFEGNNVGTMASDSIHGTHFFLTYFRNHLDGQTNNPGGVAMDGGMVFWSHNRFHNVIGNVFAAASYTQYEVNQADSGNAVYQLGFQGSHGGTPIGNDANVKRTLMRWGNWDNVTSTNDNGTNDSTGTRFASSEVPSGITNFPNPVPTSQTLPASFYLNSKPAWFGSIPWPPVGPDVANGNVPNSGGHANKIPARVCFESLADDPAYGGTLKTFNAASCYAGGDPPPDPPGGLQAIPH